MAEADIESAAAIQVDAFSGVLADAVGRYQHGARYTWRDAWVFEHGGEIGAVAIVIPAVWWFRGCRYDVSAVAGVAVRPVDRRRGLASQLMRAILESAPAARRPYSLLYPFQHGYYRRLGYGSVGLMHFYRLPIAQIPDEPALRHRVRELRPSDRAGVERVFERTLHESPEGGLERRPAQWQLRWGQDEKWVVYEDQDGLSGYLVYRPQRNTLEIRELIALDAAAERGLWSFVAAQVEQRTGATFHAPASKPLWTMLREPYMLEGPEHGFIINDAAGLTMSFMARGVDWQVALESRAFPRHVRGRLAMLLEDALLGQQVFTFEVEDGRASVRAGSAEPDVQCDVSVFSQLCGGALTASQARRYGKLEASDAAVELLDAAFPFGPPYIAPFDWF
jgi:predicted acetyltransferase